MACLLRLVAIDGVSFDVLSQSRRRSIILRYSRLNGNLDSRHALELLGGVECGEHISPPRVRGIQVQLRVLTLVHKILLRQPSQISFARQCRLTVIVRSILRL